MKRPEQQKRLWPDPKSGPWLLVIHMAPVSGRVECVGVEIRSYLRPGERVEEKVWRILPTYDDGPFPEDDLVLRQRGRVHDRLGIEPLTTVGLRIPLASIVAEVREHFPNAFEHMANDAESDERRDELLERARVYAADKRKGRGRKGLPVEHFEEVARVYRSAYRVGDAPTEAVRKHFGIGKSAVSAMMCAW